MKVTLLCIGGYEDEAHRLISESLIKRIHKMAQFELVLLHPKKKNTSKDVTARKKIEAELLLSKINTSDQVILLDEKGKQMTSLQFSEKLNQWSYSGFKRLVFVIGGAYGFGQKMYDRSNTKLSMSQFTMNHQLARIVFLEQLYRGYSILNNLPYHNE